MKTIAEIIHQKTFSLFIVDSNGNDIYYENSNGFWEKRGFNSNNEEIYYEDSHGYLTDDRP